MAPGLSPHSLHGPPSQWHPPHYDITPSMGWVLISTATTNQAKPALFPSEMTEVPQTERAQDTCFPGHGTDPVTRVLTPVPVLMLEIPGSGVRWDTGSREIKVKETKGRVENQIQSPNDPV